MAENWYMILELEFDPDPVMDEAVIEQRIEEKRKFWSSKANDFKYGPEYRKYSQMLPDIKRDMIGENNIRQKLIKEACDLTYGPIDKILKQIKKPEIPSDTIEKIAKKQKVDEETVKRRALALGIKITSAQGGDFEAVYDKYYKAKPQNADKFNGMKQMLASFHVENLYEFLYIGTPIKNAFNQPCDALRQRAKEKKKKEFYKSDSVSGTGSKLCGMCDETFKDDTSKQIYDKYIEYNRRKAILDSAKEIYELTGELTAEKYGDTVGQLTELFKDRKLAERVFTAFCKVEKVPLAMPATGDNTDNGSIKICRCGCINDISDGRKVCKNCGLELQIKCPNCGTVNDANINVCKCGFRFENIDKAVAMCELASEAIENMNFSAARAHLSDAGKYWPGSEKVRVLEARLEELEGRVGNAVDEMKAACQAKNYYAARKNYENIRKFFPNYSDITVEDEIKAAIEAAEKYRSIAQSTKSVEDIADACTRAYEACNDCPGVKEIIAKYPPSAPSGLTVSINATAKVNVLSWTRSTSGGLLYYSVVRKEGAMPISVKDGKLIGRVSMCSIDDRDISPGASYYYAVFAERAGVYSKALTLKEPVRNLFEISGLTVAAGDGALQFSWDVIAENASVEMERDAKTRLTCNNRSSFADQNLDNDREYQYRVYLVYSVGDQKMRTKGITVSGTPTRPPLPIEKLTVKPLQNHDFQIDWENPENSEVRFFYSKKKPGFFLGDLVPLPVLESAMKSLMVQKRSNLSGTFTYAGDSLIYVTAAAVKSGSAVIGAMARTSMGGAVKVKGANVFNGKILISVELPKGATGFVVLYRFDQFPESISDVKTVRKYIPLKQYEYDCGLVIDSNEPQDYYFSIFAEFRIDGEKDYSTGTDYLFSNRSREVITYSVELSKKLFGPGTLTLTFESDNRTFVLPAIDIMSSLGVAPMFKKSAKIFCQIEKQEVNGSVQIKIPLQKGMPKETYIKAFLQDDSQQGRYQLKLKVKSDLRIS